MQKRFRRELKNIGLSCVFLRDKEKKHAPLLVGELPGRENLWITLVCHADTVHAAKDFSLTTQHIGEGRLKGPGVIDNKGGIVVILSMLEKLIQQYPNQESRRLGIRVICSPNEEIGSPGFHKHFKHFSSSACAILGFEPANAGGDIIGSRQGNRWYNIEVDGLAAHSGRDHKLGVNAGHEIALKAVAFEELTNYDSGVTVNVGHLQAGKPKHNVVAAKAKALIDVRFRSLKQRFEAHKKILNIVNQSHIKNVQGSCTHAKWKIVDDCPPFQANEKSKKLFQIFKHHVEELEGKSINLVHAGGCADSNHFNRPGMPILDGLGPVGGEMHTNNEWIQISSLETRSSAAMKLVENMMNDPEVSFVDKE